MASAQGPKMYKGMAKLLAYAGSAKPNPKMGQALGPLGLNMMQVCKEFNERTAKYRTDVPMRIILKAFTDRSYNFVVKPPPTSWFLKRASMASSGTGMARRQIVGQIGCKYIYEIAKIKQALDPTFRRHNIMGICKMIIAQANNMGIIVVAETTSPSPIITKKI
jgi:large subunit ribosomal protein L11